jgi:hypothetical protein
MNAKRANGAMNLGGGLLRVALALGVLTVSGCGPLSGGDFLVGEAPRTPHFFRAENPVAGQYIVVLRDGRDDSEESVRARSRALGPRYGLESAQVFTHALQGFVVNGTEAQARALAADPEVAYVAENAYVDGGAI